ncbi:MAG: NUDIX domain-containing protein [Candidatus Pacebacteria bacterium]|nr:NUDIX domain-containing protein [Candidatus Paceibacterota bacterium]
MTKLPHQLTENTKLLHKVAIIHQGEVLILKRASDSNSRPDKWDLAGGNSEWPSDERQGHGVHREDVTREIIEETGIEVSPDNFDFSALTYFDTFFDAKKQVFTIMCGWKYKLADDFDRNKVQISDEHSEVKWIDLTDVDEIDFGGIKGEFVKKIILASLKNN